MKTRLVELNGRKAVVEGQIEDLHGLVLVHARCAHTHTPHPLLPWYSAPAYFYFLVHRALYVEPKLAGALGAGTTSAIFPSARDRVAQMTGAPDAVQGDDAGIAKSQ